MYCVPGIPEFHGAQRELSLITVSHPKGALQVHFIRIVSPKFPEVIGPGLAIQAEIKTGERRIIQYLLSPIAQTVDEAGRER